MKKLLFPTNEALKKENCHPRNGGNGICETLDFNFFPEEYALSPPPPLPPRNTGSYGARQVD